ncbi:hypothetical protein BDV06DRAFT_228700 [Aspergillus oleicola]
MSSPTIKTWIAGAPKETNPGSSIQGTVHVQNLSSEPLALSELIITIHGTGSTRIFRELSLVVVPLQGRWKSKATYVERVLILDDGNENNYIAPGEAAEHPFILKIPETSEIEIADTSSEKRRKDWVDGGKAAAFTKVMGAHPISLSTTFKSEYTALLGWGTAEAQIEYLLTESGGFKGKELLRPFSTQKLVMGAPITSSPTEQPERISLLQSLMGKHQGVTATAKFPIVLTQGEVFPIEFSINEEGFALVSLKAKLFTGYLVRGRSSWLRESIGSAMSEDKLMAWEGKQDLTKGQAQLVQSEPILSTDAVARFSTLNVACLAHELEVKFKVQDSKGKVFAGVFTRVAVDVRGPSPGEELPGEESPHASISVSKYRQWAAERRS